MLQCTAVKLLPVRDVLALLKANREEPYDHAEFADGYVCCELAEGHDGDHADFLWDGFALDEGQWFLWGEEEFRFTVLRWCPASHEEGDACGLYDGHPLAHAWDVTDPTSDALLQDLLENPEKWGLPREL